MTVAELIKEEYKTWTPGIYLINARTGAGKNHFVLNQLYDFSQKQSRNIFILVNRAILKVQQKNNAKSKNITIETCQKLEYNKNFYNGIPLSAYIDELYNQIKQFDYLVLDEAHYIFQDSPFNHYTDIVMKVIDKFQGVVLMMTATPYLLKEFYKEKIKKEYYIEPDYSYISKFIVYDNDDDFKEILSNIPQKEKAMYFGTNKEKLQDFHSEFPNSDYVCNDNNKKSKSVNQICNENKFDCRFLFTTQVLDNGINIIDPSLKHIVIDSDDITSIVQSIGRKRIESNETINVYIKNKPKNYFKFKWKELTKEMNILNDYYNMPLENFLNKYERTTYPPFIDNRENLIQTTEFWFRHRYCFVESIMNGKTTFIDEVKKNFPNCIFQDYHQIQIEENLKQNLSKKLYKNEREKLIQEINLHENGRIVKSIKKINTFFDENKIPYQIISEIDKNRKSEFFKKTYWRICSKN